MPMRHYFLFSLLIFAFSFCSNPKNTEDQLNRKFVDVAGIDSSINPGDNFFMYVNGKWYDTARIADDQVGVGSYSFLNIPQRQLLENILKEVSTQTNPVIVSLKSQVNDSF